MTDEIEILTTNTGALGGTVNAPLWRVPDGFGGITLRNVWIIGRGAATSVMNLVNFGTALGTTISSIVGTLNGTLVANVQQAFSITTAYQAAGTWLGLKTGAGGALDAGTEVIWEFAYGK